MLYDYYYWLTYARVEENNIASLHYALTDSQCSVCGAQLEWKAEFNDINSPNILQIIATRII
jgi:hypothetical protein